MNAEQVLEIEQLRTKIEVTLPSELEIARKTLENRVAACDHKHPSGKYALVQVSSDSRNIRCNICNEYVGIREIIEAIT